MSLTVCLSANAIGYPQGGGHLWGYLNWALGLHALGCRVVWLEGVNPLLPADEIRSHVAALKTRLARYGLAEHLALCSRTDAALPTSAAEGCLDLDAAAEADLLLNLRYGLLPAVVGRFQRTALVDIDPGLLQCWLSAGHFVLPRHDLYFSTGETVGQPGARFPDAGLEWHHAPPCVALDWWPPHPADADAAFTTVSHWYADEWVVDADGPYRNDKRTGFLPYLDLPHRTAQPLELALCLNADDAAERAALRQRGWRLRDAAIVAGTPWDYRHYVQASLGEFSCVKPSCVRLANAWISDRTLCYLASGKPAVVQHTGPSRFLPDADGLFRFRGPAEAVRQLETVSADYECQCRQARALVEEYLDAKTVVGTVLERALATAGAR